jgi:hypothetical protein
VREPLSLFLEVIVDRQRPGTTQDELREGALGRDLGEQMK